MALLILGGIAATGITIDLMIAAVAMRASTRERACENP